MNFTASFDGENRDSLESLFISEMIEKHNYKADTYKLHIQASSRVVRQLSKVIDNPNKGLKGVGKRVLRADATLKTVLEALEQGQSLADIKQIPGVNINSLINAIKRLSEDEN